MIWPRPRYLVALTLLAPLVATAQRPPAQRRPAAQQATPSGRRCVLNFTNTPATRVQLVRDPASGRYNTFLGGGVVANCVGQDITLVADSAELYDTIKLYYLIGNVRYREPRVSLDAQRIIYFNAEERLLAEESVTAVLPSGSKMTGPRAEYFRAVAPIRPVARLVATSRPQLTLIEKDSAGTPSDPVQLVGDQVTAEGDSVFYATGRVDITRTDIQARGDSAVVDNERHTARLMKKPEIVSKGERPFTLRGVVIDLFAKGRLVERVIARDSARATSEDLEITADTIDLRVDQSKLQRAYAWGPSRARAHSPERDMLSDSLDIIMPEQRIREVRAVGEAYAETAPDSTRLTSVERDWLRGDTIVARFDSIARSDTSSKPTVRDLVARGNASSFYQIPSKQGRDAPPAINYTRGREITVNFRQQEVQRVTVVDKAAGVYLEPGADSTAQTRPSPRSRGTNPVPIRRP